MSGAAPASAFESALLDGSFALGDLAETFHALGEDIFFVQVGAMDGISFDPIYPFVKALNWRGVLVEPLSDMFARLQKTYDGVPGLRFANCAVTDYDGTIEMTRFDEAAITSGYLPKTIDGMASTRADIGYFINSGLPPAQHKLLMQYVRKVPVPCMTLATLFAQYKVARLDLFVCDVEGADWVVVKQIPLDMLKPRVVYLEFKHLSVDEQNECLRHFRAHGYKSYLDQREGENLLAVRAG